MSSIFVPDFWVRVYAVAISHPGFPVALASSGAYTLRELPAMSRVVLQPVNNFIRTFLCHRSVSCGVVEVFEKKIIAFIFYFFEEILWELLPLGGVGGVGMVVCASGVLSSGFKWVGRNLYGIWEEFPCSILYGLQSLTWEIWHAFGGAPQGGGDLVA